MESVENVQAHRFESVKKIFWRNHLLSFKSTYDLTQSLKKQPTNQRLILKKDAEDQKFLFSILNNKKLSSLLNSPESLQQLWNVCRIPDYQSISEEKHITLLIEIFTELKNHNWSLTDLFLKKNIERLKDYSGSIDDLIYTLNETRIWLYITNQKQWIPNKIGRAHV